MRLDSTQIQEFKLVCENWIRQGQFDLAKKGVENLELEQIPRVHAAEIARLARRCGEWTSSLKLLKGIVRPEVKGTEPANASEKLEYGLALQNVGAFKEAEGLFGEISATQEPRVHLALAFQEMARWNYSQALKHLEDFLPSPGLSEYEVLVGSINRLACLSFDHDPRTEKEFASLEIVLRRQNLNLLRGNALEIVAQYWIHTRRYQDAGDALKNAQQLLQTEHGFQSLFVEKWQCILAAMKNQSTKGLTEFRPQALRESHWETLRDLDYFQTVIDPDCQWANHVYYGTPYPSFRKRLEKYREYPQQAWVSRTEKPKIQIDPWFPHKDEGEISHRFTVFLLSDFYRPFRMGEIYSSLYEGEYFDLQASGDRVRQLASRTRKWQTAMNLPISLKVIDGTYAARLIETGAILCRQRILNYDRLDFLFGRFADERLDDHSADGWAERLKVTKTKVKHLLTEAQERGVLEKEGEARYTVYHLSKKIRG